MIDITKFQFSGLEFTLNQGGTNLSVGEKQLVCLGRAILKKETISNRVVIEL